MSTIKKVVVIAFALSAVALTSYPPTTCQDYQVEEHHVEVEEDVSALTKYTTHRGELCEIVIVEEEPTFAPCAR